MDSLSEIETLNKILELVDKVTYAMDQGVEMTYLFELIDAVEDYIKERDHGLTIRN